MRYELLMLMDKNEVLGLAEAFRVETDGLSYEEIARQVARHMREE